MSRHQIAFFRQFLLAFDVAVCALAFLVTLHARQWIALSVPSEAFPEWLVIPPVDDMQSYELVMLGMLPIWAATLFYVGAGNFRVRYRRAALAYAQAVLTGLAILVTATFLFKLGFIARSFVVAFSVVQFGLLIASRYLLMETIAFLRRKHVDGHRVVIVGCGSEAVGFARSLREQSPWNLRVLGFVGIPDQAGAAGATPYLGELEQLPEVLDGQAVDEVVFAIPGRHPDALAPALRACDERGVDVLITLPPAFPSRGKMEIANMSGFEWPLLGLRRTPTGETRIMIKRVVDLLGSMAALMVAGPVMLLVALAIRMESRGPVFFKQVRVGLHGREFVMYKFRSMVVDAEQKKAALMHLNEMNGPVFKIRRDPRITAVGSFIRKTSLDELPQLLNIFFGDMSLVGPRPPLPSEVASYEAWQRRRLSVKPGLTGLWQVSGRNDVDFEQWMRLDLSYIDNWSLWLDLKILARTVPVVLTRSGAS